MKIPTVDRGADQRPDTAMTPMIDVVFLLLVFFVWTASFQAIEMLLPSQLTSPRNVGSGVDLQQEDFERIVVRIQRADGHGITWRMNGQPVDGLAVLGQTLAQLAAIRADLPVVVDPDLDIPFGDVIDVYDVARDAGLANIQFTTQS